MSLLTEDTLVQQTTADYLRDKLRWDSVYAYNNETFGPDGMLGRASDREVVLTRYLRDALEKLNPNLPGEAYADAIRQMVESNAAQSTLATNEDKYAMLRDGVLVPFRDADGQLVKQRLRVLDFDDPTNNHFLAVREFWVRGDLYRRRADIMCFVNGLPLVFIECKNIHKDLRVAYDKNLTDYKDTIPHLFHHNAIIVLGNGNKAKIGSLSAKYGHFHEWKRLAEDEPGVVDMETMLKGICEKRNLLDIVENFIVFDDSAGETVKILARNHQVLGVNQAVAAVTDREAREGKLGVFWHTQGAGKSYSMVFFTRKVHRKLGGNFTFLVCTDRDDLDTQIYKTFAGCGVVDNDKDPCRAASGGHLEELLGQHKSHIFSLIQKFHKKVDEDTAYSRRDDLVVITDEAHRTQYGDLALNMRNALPKASFIGFTGTPLFKEDEITRRVFGDYVSTYDFQRAVEDGTTVPLYYDARGDKLGISVGDLTERVAEKVEEAEAMGIDVRARLEKELKRDYHVLTARKRRVQIARDFVEHYSKAWESGKAMLVFIDKLTCVRMHELIQHFWDKRIKQLEAELAGVSDDQEEVLRKRQVRWMRETRAAVVVSEEQGEVGKFRKWGLDITPHRRLIKEGFEVEDGTRVAVDDAFKKDDHPFRIAIVCAMWLTGFDVPSLSTLYLDKPLKAHTLMQAIARANRFHEGKTNGLIVDYCGVLKNLRRALATFAGTTGRGKKGSFDPARPERELLAKLAEAVGLVRSFLAEWNAPLESIIKKTGFERNAAIAAAKEAANENDETRKHFEVLCREVFSKFKACINIKAVNRYRPERDAINIVYKSLQKDRDDADISDIIRELQAIVDEAIDTNQTQTAEAREPFDISKIDFTKLRAEFAQRPSKRTLVQNLKFAVEARLRRLLEQNPLRSDLQQRYEEIIREYNQEKDRATIEKTFADLLNFVRELDEEQNRAIRENLDEETLAVYDLLKKPELTAADIKRVKAVASALLQTLKQEKLNIDHWRDKESTRDAVSVEIHDFLWSDNTGLPVSSYTEAEVETRTEEVFRHIYRVYPTLPSPIYAAA
jgi:type I restriction enzyme R subunit